MKKIIYFTSIGVLLIIILSSCFNSSLSSTTNNTTIENITTPLSPYIETTFVPTTTATTAITTQDIVNWASPFDNNSKNFLSPNLDALNIRGLIDNYTFDFIYAFLSGDIDAFEEMCMVEPGVYDSLRNLKIGEHNVTMEDIPSVDDRTKTISYPMCEFEVLESNSDFFTIGKHKILFMVEKYNTFIKREDYYWYYDYLKDPKVYSKAETYVAYLDTDGEFSYNLENEYDNHRILRFIIGRLNHLSNSYTDSSTHEEIKIYAEKYLGISIKKLLLHELMEHEDGSYQLGAMGGSQLCQKFISEEVRDGITVVTVQFYADASLTIPSRKVEFHMELLDNEYRYIKTVILEDSGLKTFEQY